MNLKIVGAASAAALSLAALFGIPAAMAQTPPNCHPGQSVDSKGNCVNDPELIIAACVYLRLHGAPVDANLNDPKYAEYFNRTNKGLLCIDQPPAVVVTPTTTPTALPNQPAQDAKPSQPVNNVHLPVTH